MAEDIQKFIDELTSSLASGDFIKLTLSNYKGTSDQLQKILARMVETKRGKRVLVRIKFTNKDVTKNFETAEAVPVLIDHLRSGCRSAHLFTAKKDIQLTIGKRNSRVRVGRPTLLPSSYLVHDRPKTTIVNPDAYYLKALGITTDSGEVRALNRDKWKQINKFVEIVDGLYERSSLRGRSDFTVVDMGSGKGYLTFALYDHFRNRKGVRPTITGIETRQDLTDLCNEVAEAGGYDGLSFVQGTINDVSVNNADILIALHACDTATDDALFKAITIGSEIIVAAPCCHHEVKQQMKAPALFNEMLKHGVLHERTAETVTDGVRSMLLESRGYKTKLFEFVSSEHTPKNNLLVAVISGRTNVYESIERQAATILEEFGITHQRLFDRLRFSAQAQ